MPKASKRGERGRERQGEVEKWKKGVVRLKQEGEARGGGSGRRVPFS